MVVVSSARALEITLAVLEASGVFAVQVCAFLLGQFLVIWPCLLHLKQWPSFQYLSLSASVTAFRAAVLVSIAFGSLGGSCCPRACPEFCSHCCCCCPLPRCQKKGLQVVFCVGGGLAAEDPSLDLLRP